MKFAKLNHIVFYTSKISETKKFWEKILQLKNYIVDNKNLLQYRIGEFMIMFSYTKAEIPKSYTHIISHLGVEFPTRKCVDFQYQNLKKKLDISKPIGGLKKGPYRFYIKDPNGINLEFESWENCSD